MCSSDLDPKYRELVGKTVVVPLIEREIPIVADEGVEQGFGTGAVKVTPAHDPLDFEIGQRHQLEPIQVIGPDGKMTDRVPPKYRGLTVEQAREAVVADLKTAGALRSIEDCRHQIPHCYKYSATIQPL